MIEGTVPRGLHEIPGNAAAVGQLLASAPQLQHYVLRELLGHAGVVQDAVGRAYQRLVPLPEDRVERCVIALAQAHQQV